MIRTPTTIRFSAAASRSKSVVWLVWLLVASISAHSALTPSAGRDWMVSAQSYAEEESDSREGPGEEEFAGQIATGQSREQREHQTTDRMPARRGMSQRPSSPSAHCTHRPVEMARQIGIGSLLRC